jgi:hypothetical protein
MAQVLLLPSITATVIWRIKLSYRIIGGSEKIHIPAPLSKWPRYHICCTLHKPLIGLVSFCADAL